MIGDIFDCNPIVKFVTFLTSLIKKKKMVDNHLKIIIIL